MRNKIQINEIKLFWEKEKKLSKKYSKVWNVQLLCYDKVFEAASEKHEHHINNHKHLKEAKVFCDDVKPWGKGRAWGMGRAHLPFQ